MPAILTVADVNQEPTNLVTLQTRQQLAIQSLSIATESEQAVLRLFRTKHDASENETGGSSGRPFFVFEGDMLY